MHLETGTQLGPYEILSTLGAARKGEVYRALDTRLKCEVAIKFQPGSVTHDEDRVRRFEQESRAISALNHFELLFTAARPWLTCVAHLSGSA